MKRRKKKTGGETKRKSQPPKTGISMAIPSPLTEAECLERSSCTDTEGFISFCPSLPHSKSPQNKHKSKLTYGPGRHVEGKSCLVFHYQKSNVNPLSSSPTFKKLHLQLAKLRWHHQLLRCILTAGLAAWFIFGLTILCTALGDKDAHPRLCLSHKNKTYILTPGAVV